MSSIVIVQKTNKIVNVDDLDHGVHDVAFEGKVLNWYDNFDQIIHKFINEPSYACLYCEILNQIGLIMIILWIKSPHIRMND